MNRLNSRLNINHGYHKKSFYASTGYINSLDCIPCSKTNSYLNGTITTNKIAIPNGGTVIYDSVDIIGPDFSYDKLTGLFTINTAGVYFIDWKLSVTPDPGTFFIQIDFNKCPDANYVGGISITTTSPTINGSNLVYASKAGETLGFVNTSSGPISILSVGLHGSIGTISIFRIS